MRKAYAAASAQTRQIRACRRSALYAAFAAEAFINSFIAATLSTRDRERIDRNRTVDKYVLGPGSPSRTISRGFEERDELVVLERLFTLRNKLVHPKPRQLRQRSSESGPSGGATTSTGPLRRRSLSPPSGRRRICSASCTRRCSSPRPRTWSCCRRSGSLSSVVRPTRHRSVERAPTPTMAILGQKLMERAVPAAG